MTTKYRSIRFRVFLFDDKMTSINLSLQVLDGCSLLLDIFDSSNHVEGNFWEVVVISIDDFLETLDGVFQGNKLSCGSDENLSDVERLGHELLNLSGTADGQFIVFRKFIHSQNSNDILKTLVILEKLLGSTGDFIVLVSDHTRVKHTRGGVKGI